MHVNNVEAHKVVSLIGCEPSICAKNLSIDFPIYNVHSRSLKHTLMFKPITNVMRGAPQVGGAIAAGARGTAVVRAIDNISFEIKKGSRVGLIGHNGAGKTTLLRSIAGIYEPTDGNLDTTGRIMPLFNMMFALATSVTSEILLFDELIGAGDERFVSKAQQRLQAFVERSSILVVATHSRAVLDQWCNRAFLLEQGSLVHDGSVQQVLQDYDRRQAVKGG
jgi:ABC-type polysaccharide/polyol phosphate transport system ATPase subunit